MTTTINAAAPNDRELTNQSSELTEAELDHVSGGKGNAPVKYMEYKLKEVLISGVTPSL
jgi:bacteriocin-like protein